MLADMLYRLKPLAIRCDPTSFRAYIGHIALKAPSPSPKKDGKDYLSGECLSQWVEQRAGGADEEGDGDELEDRDDFSVEEGSVRCPPNMLLPPTAAKRYEAFCLGMPKSKTALDERYIMEE